MQNLFATGVNPNMGMTGITLNNNQGTLPTTNNNLPQNLNITDFNTMQNLFATGAISLQPPSQGGTGIGNISSVSSSTASGTAGTTGGATDFNTMQNLFATGVQGVGVNQGGFTMAQMQSNPSALNMNLGTQQTGTTGGTTDYNTMQNLFATAAQGTTTITGTTATSTTQQQQNININDFNTMQNLFKTGGISLTPPTQQQTSITGTTVDPFAVLGQQPQQITQ